MKDVIVLGYNLSSSLCAARAFGEAGYGVRLLTLTAWADRVAGKSKYVSRHVLTDNNFGSIFEGLEKLRGNDDKILIVPVHDHSLEKLSEHAEELKAHYYFPNINGNGQKIIQAMDKLYQKELAQSCGLEVAHGKSYSTDNESVELALQEVAYPVFLKAQASAKVKGAKTALGVCRNEQDLRRLMTIAQMNGCDHVLLEQYLEIDKELSAYGVAGNGKVFIPAKLEILRSGTGKHLGVAAEGLITSADELGELKEKLEKIVLKIGLTGLFCIDLIQSGEKIYFSEMNLRGGGSGYAVAQSGANIYGTLADMVYNGSVEGPRNIQHPVHFLSEMIDFDGVIDSVISYSEYLNHLQHAEYRFIHNETDPSPWRVFQLWTLHRLMAAPIKKLLKR